LICGLKIRGSPGDATIGTGVEVANAFFRQVVVSDGCQNSTITGLGDLRFAAALSRGASGLPPFSVVVAINDQRMIRAAVDVGSKKQSTGVGPGTKLDSVAGTRHKVDARRAQARIPRFDVNRWRPGDTVVVRMAQFQLHGAVAELSAK
jgi:hypothetical protein